MTHSNLPLNGAYLRLLLHLINNFPELADDKEFIQSRADSTNEAISNYIKQGYDLRRAKEIADHDILFSGLIFSRFNTLKEALNDLNKEMIGNYLDNEEIHDLALEHFEECEKFFDGYVLDDDFWGTLEYENEVLPALVEYFREVLKDRK